MHVSLYVSVSVRAADWCVSLYVSVSVRASRRLCYDNAVSGDSCRGAAGHICLRHAAAARLTGERAGDIRRIYFMCRGQILDG